MNVGKYVVDAYADCNFDENNGRWHLIVMVNMHTGNKKSVYLADSSYRNSYSMLLQERHIDRLFACKNNARVRFLNGVRIVTGEI